MSNVKLEDLRSSFPLNNVLTPASTPNLFLGIQSHGPFLPLREWWIPIHWDSALGKVLTGNVGGYPGGAGKIMDYGKSRVTALTVVCMCDDLWLFVYLCASVCLYLCLSLCHFVARVGACAHITQGTASLGLTPSPPKKECT